MTHKLKLSFLFLAVALSSLSRTSSLPRLKQGICGDNPAIHGLILMKSGYDIRSYSSNLFENSKRGEIFKYTCVFNSTADTFFWREKLSDGFKRVSYPDQFTAPMKSVKRFIDENILFFDHFDEFDREEGTGLNTDKKSSTFKLFGQTAMLSAMKAKHPLASQIQTVYEAIGAIKEVQTFPKEKTVSQYSSYLKGSKFRASMNLHYQLYGLAFKEPKHLNLTDDFVKEYEALPPSFLENPMKFLTFLETYGTHYIYNAKFGGRIKYSTKYDISSFIVKEKEEIGEDFKVWLNQLTENATDEIHRSKVESEITGGDPSKPVLPYTTAKIGDWNTSIYEYPSPIEISLVPIIELIPKTTIQIELALAILYSVNEESAERYKKLMKVIDKKTLEPIKSLQTKPAITFKTRYSEHYDEMNRLLVDLSADIKNMLVNCTKALRDKVSKLSIFYQNVKLIGQSYDQIAIYDDLYYAANMIHLLHATDKKDDIPRWYGSETRFEDASSYNEKFNDTISRINTLHDTSKLELTNSFLELNENFNFIKGVNDKYLSYKTYDCNDLKSEWDKGQCYTWTICSVKKYMKGWRSNETLSQYKKEVPAMKYLEMMLSSMKHKAWEDNRAFLASDNWKKCVDFNV